MPAAPVIYRTPANYGLLPVNEFVFLDFTHVNPPATLEDSLASQRARAATAILQAACSILPFSFYNAPYLPGLLAKMLYADYFFSDNCPGRTINNRDEVYDSLRNQRLWGDENTGSTFEGISLPEALGDIRRPVRSPLARQFRQLPALSQGRVRRHARRLRGHSFEVRQPAPAGSVRAMSCTIFSSRKGR